VRYRFAFKFPARNAKLKDTASQRKDAAMAHQAKPWKEEPFEKNLERLDSIVHQLEDADLPLEKALQLYEEGMRLSEVCHKQLEEAEGRIEILSRKTDGKLVAEPFDSGESGEK
jgi:exodeoxyribonuclease VII small subunit